jgi:glycosyltransferase involved in cell wall biosynthesis
VKKKILFVNGHLNVGGVENSLLNVLKSMDYNDYDIDLILFEQLGDYANEVPKEVNIFYYDLSKAYGPIKQCILENIKNRNWFGLIMRLIFLIEKIVGVRALFLARPFFKLHRNYDCAIAYRVGICTDFVGYVMNSKKKVTWWHDGTFDFPEKLIKRWIKVFKKFDYIVAVSDNTKKMLQSNIEEFKDKIITIPNIINVNEIQQKANEETIYEIKNKENITLLSVGRLSHEKGMINCVCACKKLVDNGYSVKWFLIGEGIQRREIEKLINEYKLQNNIFLLGAISNPYPYIKTADIYVHPSLIESLSISVLEALALNTPVTVAKSMGPMEFIRHNENGLLVEPTPQGLYSGIVSLIRDSKLYNHLKRDNSEVLKNYSPAEIMKKINNLTGVG